MRSRRGVSQSRLETKSPALVGARGERESAAIARAIYLANTNFAMCALAREAAFLWTTPDLVALSMAEA